LRRRLTILGLSVLTVMAAALPTGLLTGTAGAAGSLTGAGSTLITPLMNKWIADYKGRYGVSITYGSVGSGNGISSIVNRTVDFGASDAPLSEAQRSACKGCVQIPWALSATVPVYNIPGVGNSLNLTGKVIAGIYLGSIKKWNDPAIKKLNAGKNLPGTNITPVFRSDGSGDTYALTDYESRVDANWKHRIGFGTQVSFPTGIGAKGNPGIAAAVGKTSGSIGYVSVAYALSNHLNNARVQNKAGNFVSARIAQISAAAKSVTHVPANNEYHIVNPPKKAKTAYPISTFTYAITPEHTSKAQLLKGFISYAINQGQSFGAPLVFAKLPPIVLKASQKAIGTIS
jgi:phosphate transport system substrate-binding protein